MIIAGLNLTPGKHGYYTMSYPWNRPWQTGQKTYDNLGGIVIRRDSKSSGGKAWVLAFDWQTKAFRKFAGIGKTSLDWKNQPWLHVMYNRFFATRLDRPDDFVSVVAARTLDTSEEIQTLIRLGANPLEILLGPDPNWSESNPKPSNKKDNMMIFKPFMREGFMPLPIAFISTRSADKVRNIAPYSCIMPVLRPLDLICLASAKKRDTLNNIRETNEFVVNLVGHKFSDKVIPTARFSKPEADEFELAELSPKPSSMIGAPGIAGAYAWMECRLAGFHQGPGYTLVMGKVLRLEVNDACLTPEGPLILTGPNPL